MGNVLFTENVAEFLTDMQLLFGQCQQIMDVTDNELETYRIKREQMDNGMSEGQKKKMMTIDEVKKLQEEIDEAKNKLNLK